jgi:hypothetical protein
VAPGDHPFPHRFDPSRYSDYYLLSRLSEAEVQAEVVKALRELRVTCWPVDVGSKNVRGRACGALRRAGVINPASLLRAKHPGASDGALGFADVPGVLPGGRALFLEVKAPRWLKFGTRKVLVIDREEGLPTPEQLRFLAEAHMAGAVVGVVWSARDAVEIVKKAVAK